MVTRRIGIFWWINDSCVVESVSAHEGYCTDGVWDIEQDHFTVWSDKLKKRHGKQGESYDYFPRGRVLYHEGKDHHYVYLDRCIYGVMAPLKELKKKFELIKGKYTISKDPHYQCHRCNPEYVSDVRWSGFSDPF